MVVIVRAVHDSTVEQLCRIVVVDSVHCHIPWSSVGNSLGRVLPSCFSFLK